MRPVIYMAHPVAGAVQENLANAMGWLRWLHMSFPDATIIAPWIVEVMIYDDNNPAHRHASIQRSMDAASKCDALVHVGPKISAGMRTEAACAPCAFDCTTPSGKPPDVPSGPFDDLSVWIRSFDK